MLRFEISKDKTNFDQPIVLVKKGNRVLAIISPEQDGIEIKDAQIGEVEAANVAKDVEIQVSLIGEEKKIGSFVTDEEKIRINHAPAKKIEIRGGVKKLRLKIL